MKKIDEMIKQLCPNGVEMVPLWCVTAWDKKFNAVDKSMQSKIIKYPYLLAKDLFALDTPEGSIKLLSTGTQSGWTTEEKAGNYLCDGEVVTIPWGKSSKVINLIKYYKGKFVTADNRIATSLDKDILNNKYLFYWMLSESDVIDSYYRGAGIKHPSMYNVLTMQIPLPPLSIQEEIVNVLDKFSELIEKTDEEIALRQKQYEYYREKLLLDKSYKKCRIIDLLCQPITDGPHTTPQFFENGIPFVSVDSIWDGRIHFENKRGYISESFDKECSKKYKPQRHDVLMVKSGSTTGKVAYVDTDDNFNIWSPLAAMRVNENTSSRYLFHLLQTSVVQKQVLTKSSQGSQPNLGMRVLEQFDVAVPPLSKQIEIASILDKFDTLVNDLSHGLPAEIEARKQQYEYYREKLLTF